MRPVQLQTASNRYYELHTAKGMQCDAVRCYISLTCPVLASVAVFTGVPSVLQQAVMLVSPSIAYYSVK
jgi:hypothetical protein